MSVSRLIRDARLEAGLSQAELAHRMGVTQPVVARLENPGSNPRIRTLERIAAVLGRRVEIGLEPGLPEVDETQIRRNLRLTPTQRLEQLEHAVRNVDGLFGPARQT